MPIIYTYLEKRHCLYCGKAIADQEHKLLKFCPREEIPDGSVKCCKDDFHSEIRSKENRPFLDIFYHHKEMRKKISDLLKDKGQYVTAEDINRYGIKLDHPVRFRNENGNHIYDFVDYSIIKNSNNFKIIYYATILR